MRWWEAWFREPPPAAVRERLERWDALAETDEDADPATTRSVIVDVESTGLDTRRDRLIAIGAIACNGGKLDPADAFYVVLRQTEASSRENILVHGIGGTAQTSGEEPAQALAGFCGYIGKAPLVGFHAGFDAIMIDRAFRHFLRRRFRRRWLDLADLAPALHTAGRDAPRTALNAPLDDWLDRYAISAFKRHDALADAVATGQLYQVLIRRAAGQGRKTMRSLHDAAEDVRWLRQRARV